MLAKTIDRLCKLSNLLCYRVVQIEGIQSAADAGVIELPDDVEKERRATDPLYRLEKGQESRKRALTAAEEIELLQVR